MLGPVWEFWEGPGSIFGYFFRDLWKNGRSVKTNNTTALLLIFWGLGPPLEGPGGCLGRVLGALLEDVGSKMVFFGYLGRCCGILVPRWRTGAPRRGKIGELRRRGLLQGGSNPRGRSQMSPLHPPKNGFSRMGLQTPTPDSDSNWNWIWKSGRLEDWKTGGLDYWAFGFTLYTQLCLKARWRIFSKCFATPATVPV